ncbi:MAG: glycosyltransferase [bacterium]
MKILFQSRLDILTKRGGDTVQMLETKASLEKLGVFVDINCGLKADVSEYDIVHIFNLDWVCETYPQILNAKKQGKKVFLSSIHHSLMEFERYEEESRYGLMSIGNMLISNQPLRDTARNILKGFIYPRKLSPALSQLFTGIRKQQKLSLELSDMVFVQTKLEAEDLIKDFKTKNFKWKKIINGIDEKKFKNQRLETREGIEENIILCAGRIEPRKNQLKLIQAYEGIKGSGTKLVFVGSLNKHHPTYIKKFLDSVKMSNGNIQYRGFVEQKKLCALYSKARVFISPSWFETTGLVYLEAAVCGVLSIVASGERAKEYLGENALYCDPGNVLSIQDALSLALKTHTVKKGFADYIKKTYTWDNCAKEIKRFYEEVINLKS